MARPSSSRLELGLQIHELLLLLAAHTQGLGPTPVEAGPAPRLSTCTHSCIHIHTCALPDPSPVLSIDVSGHQGCVTWVAGKSC